MKGDLTDLRNLRAEVRALERQLTDARDRRDALAAELRRRGASPRDVGSAAGLAPSYVIELEKRARERTGEVQRDAH